MEKLFEEVLVLPGLFLKKNFTLNFFFNSGEEHYHCVTFILESNSER